MTLNQALAIINTRKGTRPAGLHYLVCGFQPLHLATLFRAHVLERQPSDRNIGLGVGAYGDFRGNLAAAAESGATAAAVVLEWNDVDPRLGLRSAGGWSNEAKADILAGLSERFGQIEAGLEKLAGRMPVALAPPGVPLPPLGNTIPGQVSLFELELSQRLAEFLSRAARLPGVRIAGVPPMPANGFDPKMELVAGFPYSIPFADTVAAALAQVLYQPAPRKGLITDLDDTLWSGLVGEVGAEGVSWSQDSHTQTHGVYQQMLGHLAGCGVLLGICSKNELSTVETALARKDLFIDPGSFFPVCANWGPKSASVARILQTWNIGADSVVFIDDNPMELEEVGRAFPGIECRRFSGKDPAAVWQLIVELRSLFGKPVLVEEDRLRQASIRASAQIQEMAGDAASPEFLRTLQGAVTLSWRANTADKRPLELINKTNQFNLNGLRIGEGEWFGTMQRGDTVLAVVSYQDKFGPLGKVAVLLGSQSGGTVRVSHWVMSCRSFSRRLEYHTLAGLFDRTGAEEIEFAFQATERNQPLQEFFAALGIASNDGSGYRISREDFAARCGVLPHSVEHLIE